MIVDQTSYKIQLRNVIDEKHNFLDTTFFLVEHFSVLNHSTLLIPPLIHLLNQYNPLRQSCT